VIFSSSRLSEDITVIGPVKIKLYAASSASDTDFVGRLIDVDPDGTAWNISEGIIRARFRNNLYGPEEFLTPETVYEYTITLLPTAIVFKKGHQIRVHLTSSSFPLWDRNPNTGKAQGMYADTQTAIQTIYHDENYPSHIVLPIVSGNTKSLNDH